VRIHVRSKNLAIDETRRSQVESRLAFSLGRFAARILRATVRIIDLNGPRGDHDKACRIEVRLRPAGTVLVEDRDVDLFTALDHAADRAGRAVARALARDLDRSGAPLDGESLAPRPHDRERYPDASGLPPLAGMTRRSP
jgi:putative sigma-54 modulation protein